VSPLLPLPFTYGDSVLPGQQLRALCLEIELGKRKKKSDVSISLSVPLGKGERVRARYSTGAGVRALTIFLYKIAFY